MARNKQIRIFQNKTLLRYLDSANFQDIAIMSYSVKYASAYYGPFRSACDSSLKGDRKTYQMDYRNKKEAIREAIEDV